MHNIENGKIVKIDNNCKRQSTIIILGTDNHIYLLTATPTGKFYISDEGNVNDRYDKEGNII